ncbi:unnamed protein product [Clonostachys rhizophaga]|uniref:BZIP domain-containing protein n=1 Tax=Clonostachys rhizophaga TaxID=160324 RepID=A0A9N9YLY9_9HYPO|nr:unnamed protein product [Clonostachys rhizophaga]
MMAFVSKQGQKRNAPSTAVPDEIQGKRIKTRSDLSRDVSTTLLKLPIPGTPIQPPHTLSLPLTQTAIVPSDDPVGLTSSTCSPYGQSYHRQKGTIPLTQMARCGLRIGPIAFEDAKIFLPPGLGAQDQREIKDRWQRELKLQEDNPPALPPSRVAALPAKATAGEYIEVPEGASEKEKDRIRQYNNKIASESQRIDRERNNQAAKKSRETRLEALHNTRQILNRKSAECAWLRLKLISLGGDPTEWEAMDEFMRTRMVEKVAERVTASDQRLAEEKKKEEQRRRAERTKARLEAKENAANAKAWIPQLAAQQANTPWG